jgi:protein-S-isoprenylcysteine O-methyltransferase Ste14
MISPAAVLSVLWIAWLLVWAVAAMTTGRTVVRQSMGSRLAHSIFIWGGAILLFTDSPSLGALGRQMLPGRVWPGWTGVVVAGIGLGFTGWARVHLGRLWSATVTLKEEHAIIRTGPYAVTRHPIYSGLLLALAGSVVVRGTPASLIGCVLIAVGVMVKVRQEETLLLQHFGDGYRGYQAAVPALVPRLFRRHA